VTLPVTVEDGDGVDVVALNEGDGDDGHDEEGDSPGVGLGVEAGLEADVAAACAASAVSGLCEELSRPTATTAPAVPPAISTHPTANAASVARLRPAPGIPTFGNDKHP
jgi:hypothetical protein